MRTHTMLTTSLLLILLNFSSCLANAGHAGSSHKHLTPWEQIHQTLHTYPLAIDNKDSSLFPAVFAPDAFANYTGPLSNLTGIEAITTALQASVANVLSQHQLGTTVIGIHEPTGHSGRHHTANSTTYFVASLFGTGEEFPMSSHVYLYGQYRDVLARLDVGWRITKRQLVFMGPFVGDQSLLGG